MRCGNHPKSIVAIDSSFNTSDEIERDVLFTTTGRDGEHCINWKRKPFNPTKSESDRINWLREGVAEIEMDEQ